VECHGTRKSEEGAAAAATARKTRVGSPCEHPRTCVSRSAQERRGASGR
jgi:hypothetical protein